MGAVSTRRRLAPLAALLCLACVAETGPAQEARPGPAPALSDPDFAGLVASLSEEGGYFDTDNLISNETSYLHALGPLRRLGVSGGAYVGVGPGQNFSYVAEVRPRIAFIVDIRRDNLLQHLLFKALFESAPTRVEYLALLLGRPAPDDPSAWRERSVEELVGWVDGHAPTQESLARARRTVDSAVAASGLPLEPGDSATVRRFHDAFVADGLDLRFNTYGRAPRPYYPTLRQLVLERDLTGEGGSFLADADDYAWLRELQRRNLVVPVVGDLAGDHALRAVGDALRERGEVVTALYTSNVEYYLFRDGTFPAFAANVASLPRDPDAVIVRSYFPTARGRHPLAVPGYWSAQLVHPMERFVEVANGEGFRGYLDLVTRDAVEPRIGATVGGGGP